MKSFSSILLLSSVLSGVLSATRTDKKHLGVNLRLASRAENVQPAECPYYASIQISRSHDCGGALISKSHVLTAAHCVLPVFQGVYMATQVTVEVGSVFIGRGKTHSVKRISYHRNYESTSPASSYIHLNDIAVITLATPVTESEHVKIIGLPHAGLEVPAGAVVKVSGYGNARLNGPTSQILKKSDLYVISHWECNDYFTSYLGKSIQSNSQLCAKGSYGQGACQGDSGGPMVYNNQVVGLVSAGDGNCGSGNPDIYTKVSNFLTYIRSELNGGDQSQSIALDLSGKSKAQKQLYPSVGQYPWTQTQYYPTTKTEYYPQVGQYPSSQYPTVLYPGGQHSETHYYPSITQQIPSQSVYYPIQTVEYPYQPSQTYYPGQQFEYLYKSKSV